MLGVLFLTACVTEVRQPSIEATNARAQLLTSSPYGVAPDVDVLGLDKAMRDFVNERIKAIPLEARASALGNAFMRGGVLALRYDQEHTRSASDTYASRSGNCLAFSQLFVALARASGLHVRFREDRHIESWSRLGSVLLLNRHVTVWGVQGGNEYEIDFGRMAANSARLTQLISDERARAQYFNNLGAEAFAAGDPARAIPYFNRALLIEPTVDFVWTNLAGALRNLGRLQDADLALRVALQLDPRSESALNGLARLYRARGDITAAEGVEKTLTRYRERNPYRHFEAAEEALTKRDYTTAIAHLQSALRMNPDEPDFNFELGRAYLAQGRMQLAAKRFKRVEQLAVDNDQSHIYAVRLAELIRAQVPTAPPSS